MNGGPPATVDLLGSATPDVDDIYSTPVCEPGRTVDLSGGSARSAASGGAPSRSGFGGGARAPREDYGFGAGSSSASGASFGDGRGPRSIEGGSSSSYGLALSTLTPSNLVQQLASRPVSDLVRENGRALVNLPMYMLQAYTLVAQRYLQPWRKFVRVNPGRVAEGLTSAARRGEIQIHLQRNVLANARAFCPNYAFIFVAMMFFFVCTSPILLGMLGAVGGCWSHAMRSEQFRSRPWTLQIGAIQVPLGANTKRLALSVATLFFLNLFMGPILWSAALYSGGVSLAHAALRDRDHEDTEDPGPGGFGGGGFGIQDMA